jgi:predicted short-subunit dehydrogenase-like oxidoreductase (DUF2520 family)
MVVKPTIAIVGAGRLGTALATALRRAGYAILEVVSRPGAVPERSARQLANRVGAEATSVRNASLLADVIWFCVPDREIAAAAASLAPGRVWRRKSAFHSSGALPSDELKALRRRGASVASVHPLMTFVTGSVPPLEGVAFAVEGDSRAKRLARRIVRDLKGDAFSISADSKPAYHAWGAFTSPLLVAMLRAGEEVAGAAGLSGAEARQRMLPIIMQTLANYIAFGAADSFSGPVVRGDVEVVRRHLRILRRMPEAREVYLALSRAALKFLPARNKGALRKVLATKRGGGLWL